MADSKDPKITEQSNEEDSPQRQNSNNMIKEDSSAVRIPKAF
jgi:hypothetical protein